MSIDLSDVKWDDPFDTALKAEGVTGKAAAIARSIYQQESSSGANPQDSNPRNPAKNAIGPMQVIGSTFKSVADPGWDIRDPEHNLRAGLRYLKQGYEASGGDPVLTGAYYYGGPGGMAKARRGVAVRDPDHPNAPDTLQYGQQVAARLPKERGIVQRAVEGMIPSAEAAQPQVDLSDVKWDEAPAAASTEDISGVPRVEVRGTSADEAPADQPGVGSKLARAAMGAVNPLMAFMPAQTAGNMAGGLVQGAADIGATIIRPFEGAQANQERRAAITAGLGSLGADTDSTAFGAGRVGANIAGTAGIGGAVAAPLRAIAPNVLGRLATSIGSGGMTAGPGGSVLGNLALRATGGAVAGGAGAAAVDPSTAGVGAGVGAAIPLVGAGAAAAGRVGGMAARGATRAIAGQASPEVAQLAQRAEALGINIPADRIVNSRPLNAVAAGLNYTPFAGRQATEEGMQKQLNQALSRTFGQDSDNVTGALRKAGGDLGQKFDTTLKANTVAVDKQLLDDLGEASAKAVKELEPGQATIINNQIDEIIAKAAATGEIDGQAAYNIKKTLDRIGQQNSPQAYYARDLKGKLMDALNRSLGPQEAAAFAETRKQYSNMLKLENIAQNGVDGDVSIARIANMKNIGNPELQELADISAQFLKPREGMHGAAQRAGVGALLFGIGGLPGLALGAGIGRGTNTLLNSGAARNAVLGYQAPQNSLAQLMNSSRNPALYRSAPGITGRMGSND